MLGTRANHYVNMSKQRHFNAYFLTLRKVLCLSTILLFLLSGCQATTTTNANDVNQKQIMVAATIFPLSDITQQLGGNHIKVITLLPSGASPHTFEPTPDQIRALESTQLFITVGPGLDDWAAQLGRSGSKKQIELTILDCIPKSSIITEGTQHTSMNPHVWLDPVLVRDHIAPAITKALVQAAPAHRDYFESRLKDYQRALDQLDQAFVEHTAHLKHDRFISIHAAWSYLANRYGLEQVAIVESSPGQEPSARWVTRVVDLAHRHDVTAVLAEPQLSTKTAEVIATELGGQVIFLDPLGGPDGSECDSYIGLMNHNLNALVNGLQDEK